MFKIISIATIVLTMLLGTAGITIAAAQNSQPGEPLYAVRTWSEQMLMDRTMLQTQTQLQQTASDTPLQTQDQIRLQTQDRLNEQLRLREQDRINQAAASAPQNKGGGNPWTDGTPTPGSSYGPGPGTCIDCTCTPQAQYGLGGQGQNSPGHGNKP